jgi:hypothetical protein
VSAQSREPIFLVAAINTPLVIAQGWKNITILPRAGATVSIDNGTNVGTFSIPIILGGSDDRAFDSIWGQVTITSTGASTDIVVNGNIR